MTINSKKFLSMGILAAMAMSSTTALAAEVDTEYDTASLIGSSAQEAVAEEGSEDGARRGKRAEERPMLTQV